MKRTALITIVALSTAWAGINEWTSLGPYGGKMTAIVIDPQNSKIVYAGTTGNGVFKSVDGGMGWKPANAGLPSYVIALAIAPTDNSTLYAAVNSYGVYKSTDGGSNWKPVRSGLSDSFGSYSWVFALAVDPAHPAVVYAAGEGGVFKTTDGGDHWNLVLPANWVTSLAIDPGNPTTVYAAGWVVGFYDSVVKTTDGGASWNPAGAIPSRGSWVSVSFLLIDPKNPETIYGGSGSDGVFKSVDAGATWNAANSGLPDNFRRAFGLAMDPANPRTLYALMLSSPPVESMRGRLFRSLDGGGSWEETGSGLPAESFDPLDACSCAPLKAGLAVGPETPGALYIGTNSEGVFKSVDAGASWKLSSSGLTANRASLAIDPRDNRILYAATPTRVFKSVDAGANWSAGPWGPDGFMTSVALDATNPEVLYAGTLGYGEDGRTGQVVKSIDGGRTWEFANLSNRVGNLTAHPQMPAMLYAYTWWGFFQYYALYSSMDGAHTWSKFTASSDFADFFTSSVAFDHQDPGSLLAGGSVGKQWVLLRSNDAGANWSPLASTEARITAVAIDPQDTNTIYAGCSFQGCTAGIWKSTDGGVSLLPSGPGLPPDLYVWSIIVDPQHSGKVYARTNKGVFRTTNSGASWSLVGSALPDLVASSLPELASLALDASDSNTLYAGTVGGVYVITLSAKE